MTGHSLGAGIASIIHRELKGKEGWKRTRCFAYGPPCCVSAAVAADKDTVSVVRDGDPFRSLSLGHVLEVLEGVRVVKRWRGERDEGWLRKRLEKVRGLLRLGPAQEPRVFREADHPPLTRGALRLARALRNRSRRTSARRCTPPGEYTSCPSPLRAGTSSGWAGGDGCAG